jgi:hypothetical protein
VTQQDGKDQRGQPERRQLTPEEMYRLLAKEKLDPLAPSFMRDAQVDLKKALADYEKVVAVKRRQFLAEKVEESYKYLLEAVRNGPDKDKHRNELVKLIEDNIRWSKNNIAAVGRDHAESPLFVRVLELSEQYQKALQDMDAAAAAPPSTGPTLDVVAQKIDALHTKADAIQANTEELKATVPETIKGQAQTIRDQEDKIARLKAALAQRLVDMVGVYQRVAPADMNIFSSFMREGNQVRVAERLGIKEQTLRARVAQWPTKGAAYRRLHDLYLWRKESGRAPQEVPYFDNLLYEGRPAPDVDSRLLTDIAEIIRDMTPENMEQKQDELLTNYLKEYAATA